MSGDVSREKLARDIEEAIKIPHTRQIVWKNAIGFLAIHLMALYALYLTIFVAQFPTYLWSYALCGYSSMGITVGAHRLYTHRGFKANTGLRLFLLVAQTLAGQNCCYIWVRDHRQHHKYSDTNADPHNATRGFFFSHIGWLMVKKHPAIFLAGKTIDMSDLEADAMIMFQKKYYKTLYLLFSIIIPVAGPCLLWGETLWNSLMLAYVGRYVYLLNATWIVNSVAHLWGTHPYDKSSMPAENVFVAFFAWGEGWHNYHHAYPWDYRASEFGMRWNINASFIEWCASYGWATDLRTASKEVVHQKVLRTGDGSHHLWGFGAKDMDTVTRNHLTNEETERYYKKQSIGSIPENNVNEKLRL